MAQGYIGQNQIDVQAVYDSEFAPGDKVTWKSAPGIPWTVESIVDDRYFIIVAENGNKWNTWQKWFKKID